MTRVFYEHIFCVGAPSMLFVCLLFVLMILRVNESLLEMVQAPLCIITSLLFL